MFYGQASAGLGDALLGNLDQQKKGSNEHNRHRNCPNISCGASVSFKVHDGKDFSLKFCYECYSRLKYIYRSDIVEVEEKIVPKSVTKEDISKDGLYCPYCLTEADGASTRNSRGERLAVCWGCKGLFKYTD